MNDFIIGFIGFGLIGGSIARTIREEYKNSTLIAYNYHPNQTNPSLERAKEDGILNRICTDLKEGFSNCDLIFLCAPVLTNIAYLKELKSYIKPNCILTDVGSVKGNIHKAIKELDLEENFIGGHPMAGSEKTGYEHSSSHLLENAYYILTPTPKTPSMITKTMYQFALSTGALPVILNAKEHDDITAAISHVPHIIAAALVNMVRKQETPDDKMRSLAAGGFRDITRIASSSPVMWQNICLTNQTSIRRFLLLYQKELKEMEQALEQGEESFLYNAFENAKDYRDSIPNKMGGILGKVFEIYIDIIDETGAIATMATILASNGISIKNIGIIHNREFQDGVLRIELYEQIAYDKSIELLKQYHYSIYHI